MRDRLQGLTNSSRNNQWKERLRRDKAHGRKIDNDSKTLGMRKVNLEQAKVRDVGSAAKSVVEEMYSTDSESDSVSDAEMMMSDDSMDIIMQYKQTGPGNGRRGQGRGRAAAKAVMLAQRHGQLILRQGTSCPSSI